MATRTRKTSKPAPAAFAERTPALEWIAAGMGAMLTLGAIGYLGWEGLQPADGPPVVTARVERVSVTPAGHVVEIRVANARRETASAVEIEGVLERAGAEVETSAVTFDYVPGMGERTGALVFRNDPRSHALSLAAKGHVTP